MPTDSNPEEDVRARLRRAREEAVASTGERARASAQRESTRARRRRQALHMAAVTAPYDFITKPVGALALVDASRRLTWFTDRPGLAAVAGRKLVRARQPAVARIGRSYVVPEAVDVAKRLGIGTIRVRESVNLVERLSFDSARRAALATSASRARLIADPPGLRHQVLTVDRLEPWWRSGGVMGMSVRELSALAGITLAPPVAAMAGRGPADLAFRDLGRTFALAGARTHALNNAADLGLAWRDITDPLRLVTGRDYRFPPTALATAASLVGAGAAAVDDTTEAALWVPDEEGGRWLLVPVASWLMAVAARLRTATPKERVRFALELGAAMEGTRQFVTALATEDWVSAPGALCVVLLAWWSFSSHAPRLEDE